MTEAFPRTLSLLRKERGISQRSAAEALHVSQALLSHYENGAREPGLAFVCKACDYYGVSADYMLGRTDAPGRGAEQLETLRALIGELRNAAERAEETLDALTSE